MTYQRHTAPRSLPGPDDTLRQTLPNGITILVRENFASPAVVVNGYLEVGAEDEPRGSFGLAGFVSDVMERGTRRRPFDHVGVVGEQQAQAAGPAVQRGQHRRQVVVVARGVVHAADPDARPRMLHRRDLVVEQAYAAALDERRLGRSHEGRLAVAVIVVAGVAAAGLVLALLQAYAATGAESRSREGGSGEPGG